MWHVKAKVALFYRASKRAETDGSVFLATSTPQTHGIIPDGVYARSDPTRGGVGSETRSLANADSGFYLFTLCLSVDGSPKVITEAVLIGLGDIAGGFFGGYASARGS